LAVLILLGDDETAYPTLPITAEAPEIGATVFAIGSPRGLNATLSTGNVSQRRDMDGCAVVQTTAPISPGSSGGPLLDTRGRVVGVVRFLIGGQNLNFAVAAAEIRPFLAAEHATRSVFQGRDAAREWVSVCNQMLLDYLATLKGAKPSEAFGAAYEELKEERDDGATPQARLAQIRTLRSSLPDQFEPWLHELEGRENYRIAWSEYQRAGKGVLRSSGYAEAVRCYEEGLRRSPSADHLRFRLCSLYSLPSAEDVPKLLSMASELVRRRPYDAEAYRVLGLGHDAMSNDSEAVEAYRKATDLDPAMEYLWYSLANAQLDAKDYDGAIESFEKYRERGGESAMAIYGIGLAHERAGRYETAIDFFITARDTGPALLWKNCDERIQRCRAALKR
jgi:tetratricopeptide (TPR) repeat protein